MLFQYRSIILYTSEEQKAQAEEVRPCMHGGASNRAGMLMRVCVR